MGLFVDLTTLHAQSAVLLWPLAVSTAAAMVAGGLYVQQRLRGSGLRQRLANAHHQIDEMRSRDRLTQLMARTEFERALDAAVQDCNSRAQSLAVLYLGLDNFRQVNEAYGMRLGDALLVQVAERLTACMRDKPVVSRLAGDEFLVLVEGGPAEAVRVVRRVLASMQQRFLVEAQELHITASMGVAVYPSQGSRPQLIGHAGLAMRSVKLGGGAAYAHFHPSMAVDLRDQAELLVDLRTAVERGQLQLYFQPKVDARSLQITAAEALLRWQHPKRGMVSPAVFIPLAERHGLIRRIGAWVIEEACRQSAEWRRLGLRMRVAVNISGYQLRQDDLVEQIEASIRRHSIRPERLTVEITESVAMEDTAQTRAAFERLRRAGLHVSIDDFGTGHSSLASLRKLPAAELKIDRAFVTDLASSADARSIAKAIVQMAHSLDLKVVAEGVETAAQRDLLVAMGCDELQGFFFAIPMTAKSLALWADGDDAAAAPMFRASLFRETDAAPL